MVIGLSIVMVCWALGEGIARAASLHVPGSVLGMLLLVLALETRVVRREHVEAVASSLTRLLTLFFVPVGVGVFLHTQAIAAAWIPIVASSLISMALVLWVVGWIHQRMSRT